MYRGIVEDQCGAKTADFVQAYLFYLQDRFGQALESAGLHSEICDYEISSDILRSRRPLPSSNNKLGISRMLQITVPGTALDTVWAKYILATVDSGKIPVPLLMHISHFLHVYCLQMTNPRTVSSIFCSLPTTNFHLSTTRLNVANWNSLQRAGTCYSRSVDLRYGD